MATSIVPKDREQLSAGTARILDASRAIAAFAVLLQHARSALLVDPESATRSNVATTILYWASGFGHQAVVIFFVLSGALVGGSVLRSVSSEEWSWRAYLIRRLSRLYIVLIPALLLILLWDGLGAAIFPAHGIYGDVMSAITLGGHTLIVHNRGAMAYAGNIAFLMTIYVPVLGSGAALWSLSNVSVQVRGLVDWQLVRQVRIAGSRKDHYAAATDFWRVMQEILERRFRWNLRQVLAAVDEAERGLSAGRTNEQTDARRVGDAFAQGRLNAMRDYFLAVDAGLGAFSRGEPMAPEAMRDSVVSRIPIEEGSSR